MGSPNVVLILVDDLGWRDLTCYGSSFYETPNIDALREQGVLFTDAYASCPVCSPTRASILTGKHPARVGVTNYIAWRGGHPNTGRLIDAPYVDHLPAEETSLAAALSGHGYACRHVGKWHLGHSPYLPTNHGFLSGCGASEVGMPPNGYFSPWNLPNLEDAAPGTYLTDHLTDEAIRIIRESGERPFFLNLWYYAVHTPIQGKPNLVEKYRKKARDMGLSPEEGLEEGAHFPGSHRKSKRILRRKTQSDPVYAAMVENLDANIGRVLEALEDEGKAQDTLVVLTSDNGGLATSEGSPTCNAPLAEGKGWMYEGGTRVSLLVRWPDRVAAGSVCSVPVCSMDIYPTILEAAELPPRPEQHRDGVSILPLLHGAHTLDREALFWHFPHYGNQGGTPASSIRMGDHKLIEFFEDGHVELFDLRADIGEDRNLALSDPKRVQLMRKRLEAWRSEIEAAIPQNNPDYVPWPDREPCGHFAVEAS